MAENNELKVESGKWKVESGKWTFSHFPLSTFHFLIGVLLISGHLLPWAGHATAALTLSANDLAFFTHFTPGAGIFRNEWFYLPLLAGAVQVVRASARRGLAVGIGVAALALPRYQFLIALLGAARSHGLMSALSGFEFGLQLGMALLLMGALIGLAVWQMKKPVGESRRLAFLLELVCLAACLVSVIGFLSVRSAIETLYRDNITLGTGWWLTCIAIFGFLFRVSAKMTHAVQS